MVNRFLKAVIDYPKTVLLILALCLGFLAYQALKLEVDASAETLMLEDDKDLEYTRLINTRYGNPDFLFITYRPKTGILEADTLADIKKLQSELEALPRVQSVTNILNVPLLESPPKPVRELMQAVPTLETPGIDYSLARKEFLNSPIYNNLLVNDDFTITALQVNLHDDEVYRSLLHKRNNLRQKQKTHGLTPQEEAEFAQVLADFKAHRDKMRIIDHETILNVREIMTRHHNKAELFLGGVAMIADDMVSYIKSDLRIFGTGVLGFLVITLWVIFRQPRWVVIPMFACFWSVVATAGFLGWFGWEVTVISSNFVSLQLIITMAITIHLIVRYREQYLETPEADQKELIYKTVSFMAAPCFYMAATTVAGFASLLLSGILPVINFGWMMSVGISVSLLLTFPLFASLLALVPKLKPNRTFEDKFTLTKFMANLTEHRGNWIMGISIFLGVACVSGALQLKVENSFIDYFKSSTEIYKGMKVIDTELGGTTPLDVIVDLDRAPVTKKVEVKADLIHQSDDDFAGEFDQFEAEFAEEETQAQYWFTSEKMETVEKVHDYLVSVPEAGKVTSLGTMLKVGRVLNDGKPLDNFLLALIYNELPLRFRTIILDPYVNVENNQVRFSVRVRDSEPGLRRDELLKRIKKGLIEEAGLKPEQVHMTNLLVLYNNMLQSLYFSQIQTLWATIAALAIMFWILFRSSKIAFIGVMPNMLSVGAVLGYMGWVGIPLDMMTITIAAISMGIAVDDTIHYLFRFREEIQIDWDYIAAMHRCHESIGYAMYYTSITIIIGFGILVLSNFIPSIYFGFLTGLAMVFAWLTAVTLLPRLIIMMKPYGTGPKLN